MTAVALDSIRALRRIAAEVAEEVFMPLPSMTVSAWADANRMLPSTSAEPGHWRTDRVPYLRQVMDTLGDETVRDVIFVKSAQVGGSSCGENYLGYLIDQAPCAILSVWQTEKMMKSWSKKRLKPLLEDTPCLAVYFPRSGRRAEHDTIAEKEFPGGFLQMLTAKSTSDLRSTSARVAIAEEIDEWEGEIGDQGDPLEQLRARLRTFWNRKMYMVSTPTLDGFSRIWGEWERSTQHRYLVPCPHCQHKQILRWRDGESGQDESGSYRLVWEKDDAGEVIPGTAQYICEGCGVLIEERHKMGMLLAGGWEPAHPERATVGFHINTLYSPLCSWDDIAVAFTKAVRSPALMQAFVNLWLGLPYRSAGESIDAHFLSRRAESYGEDVEVPHGVGVLTAGVDVQGDRLELLVYGWGEGETSWLVQWVQLEGDPGLDQVWADLDGRLLEPWRHASGAPIAISAACVDAGYQTERVHRFCDQRSNRHIVAVVGRDGRPRKLIEAPGAEKYRRSRNQKRPTHVVGVDAAKDLLAARLRLGLREDLSAPPGYVHFPVGVDPVFYDQLTAERLVTVYKAARPMRVWRAVEGRRNESLDMTVYAMAALQLLMLRRALTPALIATRAAQFSARTKDAAPPPKPPPRRRGGGWVGGWKG